MLLPKEPGSGIVEYFQPSTADIENRENGSLLHVSLFYENRKHGLIYEVFTNWEDWLTYVIKYSKRNKHLREIWAHNGANYDWQHLGQYIIRNRPDIAIEFRMSGSVGINATLRIEGLKYQIHLNDSFRLLPRSLKDLSHDLNVEHKKIGLDNELPEVTYNRNPDLYFEYLKNDTIGLSECLLEFWKLINSSICQGNPVEKLKATLAAEGMEIFKRSFLKTPVFVPWIGKVKDWEKRAYHGGLVLCPNHGVYNNCSMFDVNSMYPSAMVKQPVPTNGGVIWTKKYRPGKLGIYYIKFELPETRFPYIYDENGNLTNKGKAYVTSIEYEDIIKHGSARIIEGFTYRKSGLILKDYSETLYKLKKESKENGLKSLELISKLLLNSLYGKFAQSETAISLRELTLTQVKKLMDNHIKVTPAGDLFQVEEFKRCEYTFVGIAAFITARARLTLINAIRENYNSVLYADTDSLIIQGSEHNLKIGKNLGDWSIEFQNSDVILLGRKCYAVLQENKVIKLRVKGISLKSLQDKKLTDLDIANLLREIAEEQIESYEFYFYHPPTNKDVFSRGKISGEWVLRHRKISNTSDLQKSRNFEQKVINSMFRRYSEDIETGNRLTSIIIRECGGIRRYSSGYGRGEYERIPLYLRRKNGQFADQIAEHIKEYHPEFGIETEDDLLNRIEKISLTNRNKENKIKQFNQPEFSG